jgi:hypothetical protein
MTAELFARGTMRGGDHRGVVLRLEWPTSPSPADFPPAVAGEDLPCLLDLFATKPQIETESRAFEYFIRCSESESLHHWMFVIYVLNSFF